MLQQSTKLEPRFTIERTRIDIVTKEEAKPDIIWYLGTKIPYLIEGLDNGEFELIQMDSPKQLLNCLEQKTNKLPEAILILDSYLVSLETSDFADLRIKNGFSKVSILFLSHSKNAVDNRTITTLGIDGYFASKIKLDDLTEKISFSKKIKKLDQSIEVPFKERRNDKDLLLKRIFDIIFAGSALILLLPILLIIAILIKLESSGPIFYISKRAGTNYKIFDFYKFRTMIKDADKKLKDLSALNQYQDDQGKKVFYKIQNDPRVTRLGRLLRDTSLDELPQLLNILKGDMSIVGNRPLPLYEAEMLTNDEYAERFLAPSGLTGLWQVRKRGTDEVSKEERIELDKTYARNHSFLFDIKLILQTVPVFIQKESV